MTDGLPPDLDLRHPTERDHPRVLAVLDDWWGDLGGAAGARQRALLLPRLFFQHFTDTSHLLERADGTLAAFLIGFASQSDPDVAYVHFVGVDPVRHGEGIGRALYTRFIAEVARRGARTVRCVTGPDNRASLAFHTRMGFAVVPGDTVVDGVAVHRDYDGPGYDRIVFSRRI